MADRTDRRLCTAEELLLVAIQTRLVLGVVGYVGKRVLFGPDLFPIVRRKLVTLITADAVCLYVVRKLRIFPGHGSSACLRYRRRHRCLGRRDASCHRIRIEEYSRREAQKGRER